MVGGSKNNSEITKFIFDTKGRLNFRRFEEFQSKFPKSFSDIKKYSIGLHLPESTFRYQILAWLNKYTNTDLICRRPECNNIVPWKHQTPQQLCSNKCRKIDGALIGENLKKSNVLNYGVTSTAKLDYVKEKFKKTILSNNSVLNKEQYYDIDYIINNFLDNENHFLYKKFMKYFGVIQPTAHNHIKRLGIEYTKTLSGGEKEVLSFIKNLNIPNIRINTRKIIPPQELDIFLPDINLAIEYNGLYWHSFGKEDFREDNKITFQKFRHKRKTDDCRKKDILLLHILQNEWEDIITRDIWKSIIKLKLGIKPKKINARQCRVVDLTDKRNQINSFLDDTHLQGSGPNWSIAIGLIDKTSTLVEVMTFGKSRYNDAEYELYRMSSLKNTIIRGGASKLLNFFEKTFKPQTLHTFADKRFSTGKVYDILGFQLLGETSPNFKVFKKNSMYLEPREKYQKHKLNKLLSEYNPKLTAIQNLAYNDYRIIWDSGNYSYRKAYKW
jgi:endogenous inhibitor of DNA gyrase (YacG/DUF329 family)